MKDFERWFRDFELKDPKEDELIELPDGIREGTEEGEYLARCYFCKEWKPIFVGLDEIPKSGYEHYCGSQWCCP